jgi:hypothetical protein
MFIIFFAVYNAKNILILRIPGNIPGANVSLESEIIRYIKYHVNPETDKIKIKISGNGSKGSRISNFVVLSFSVITDDK